MKVGPRLLKVRRSFQYALEGMKEHTESSETNTCLCSLLYILFAIIPNFFFIFSRLRRLGVSQNFSSTYLSIITASLGIVGFGGLPGTFKVTTPTCASNDSGVEHLYVL